MNAFPVRITDCRTCLHRLRVAATAEQGRRQGFGGLSGLSESQMTAPIWQIPRFVRITDYAPACIAFA